MTYVDIIEDWVREFILTMDHPDDLYPGNDSGDSPYGVKIIFDGFGADEETCEENANRNMMCFAVFVHRDSVDNDFPPHELTPWALVHRPKEEACFYVWHDVEQDIVECISDIDELDSELGSDVIVDLIQRIYDRDHDE